MDWSRGLKAASLIVGGSIALCIAIFALGYLVGPAAMMAIVVVALFAVITFAEGHK